MENSLGLGGSVFRGDSYSLSMCSPGICGGDQIVGNHITNY
jgi:hypothetical protein